MAFGISFGGQKTSGKTSVDKRETVNQAETAQKTSTGTTSTTGTTATSQAGTSSTSQLGQTATQAIGSETSQIQTQQFSDQVLAGLESAVSQLFGKVGAASDTDLTRDSSFDPEAFIAAGMDAASSRVSSDLDVAENSLYDQFGGRDDSNSMVNLLATRARSDAGSALAGERSKLGATAEGILRENQATNIAGAGQSQNFLATLMQSMLGGLKGGVATSTGATQTAEATAGQQAQTGTAASQQTGTETTQQTQIQQLAEMLSSILTGTTHTVGTEKTKGKTYGGGIGLSI